MDLPKDLTILDLIVLEKVEKDSILDSFGGKLYSSFFDTAALMGTLQVKRLVEINSAIGRSIVNRSESGEKVLMVANERAAEPLDELDHAILKVIAGGIKNFMAVKSELNLRSDDLAMHLFRLIKQHYIDYEIRNAKLSLNITEGGFKLTGFVPKKPQPVPKAPARPLQQVAVPQGRQLNLQSMSGSEDATAGMAPTQEPRKLTKTDLFLAKLSHQISSNAPAILVALVVIVAAALYFMGYITF